MVVGERSGIRLPCHCLLKGWKFTFSVVIGGTGVKFLERIFAQESGDSSNRNLSFP